MSGGSLTTKGLVGGGGGSITPEQLLPPEPPLRAPMDTGVPTGAVVIVIPTAPNVVLMAAENITVNLRARQAASLELPSIYKRAYMIAHETDEMAVVKPR
jgi:hypothetical protein